MKITIDPDNEQLSDFRRWWEAFSRLFREYMGNVLRWTPVVIGVVILGIIYAAGPHLLLMAMIVEPLRSYFHVGAGLIQGVVFFVFINAAFDAEYD